MWKCKLSTTYLQLRICRVNALSPWKDMMSKWKRCAGRSETVKPICGRSVNTQHMVCRNRNAYYIMVGWRRIALLARYIRIVEVRGSNPLSSTPKKSFLTRVRELFSFSRSSQKLGMRMYRFLLDYWPLMIKSCYLVMKPTKLLIPRNQPCFSPENGHFSPSDRLGQRFFVAKIKFRHFDEKNFERSPPWAR